MLLAGTQNEQITEYPIKGLRCDKSHARKKLNRHFLKNMKLEYEIKKLFKRRYQRIIYPENIPYFLNL